MIRVAIVGYGYWGPNLVRNFAESEAACAVAVCDKSEDRLRRAALRHPGIAVTTSFEDLVRRADVDAIAIATPVQTHYELAKSALEHGKHVLVEKPLTMRVDHAQELVELARCNGLVLMVDHVFVYSPAVAKIKEVVESGRLGKLFFIDSVRINLGLFQHDVNVVWDLAPHDLSIVDYLIGRLPVALSATGAAHAGNGIEDVAYLNLDYGNGLIANFHVNWLSPVKVRQMIIGGSEQSLIYNDMDLSEKIKVYDRGISLDESPEGRRQTLISYRSGDVWAPNVPNSEPLGRLVKSFADCIAGNGRCLSAGEEGLRIVQILDAAQRSIKAEGHRVTL